MAQGKDKAKHDILHEFGHAPGLNHEHQHPDCKIIFDRSALRNQGLEDFEIQRDYEKKNVVGAMVIPHDVRSIMHYSVVPKIVKNLSTEIPHNDVLSDGDKEILMTLYPAIGACTCHQAPHDPTSGISPSYF
ncbi:hypothetical protein F5Y11DRAFT_365285 [Daldinia sp. FL1419]|nr:hypothetical protein F5Y11DRAFT_365285 [Daldinia sp. FL1419]